MIEIYRTNIEDDNEAAAIAVSLLKEFPYLKVDFDLEDCDHILRVQGKFIPCKQIRSMVSNSGYECSILE